METPKTIGRYEIVQELGHGAMGAVFLARDPAMDRTVALKTILSGALAGDHSDEFRARFYREARAAGALAHPGIVPVFDVGEFEGSPYLVMEFVNGQTLADAMKKGERQSMDRICEIGQQIAEALGFAHRKGVIHRDIKPANILMTSRETYGIVRPRITDFGVAKLTAGEITTTGQMLGTPAFMPPEQFTGAPIDGRADLFSLGVILYWMATGEQPFPGETMTTVSYKIVHTEPVPPAKLNPLIPAQLDKLILKCLSKSPADRFQTGEELAQALTEVRRGATPASINTPAPQAVFAAGDPDATLNATPIPSPKTVFISAPTITAATATVAPPNAPTPQAKNRSGLIAAAAALLIAIAAGGWFLLHRNNPPAPPLQAEATPAPPATEPAQDWKLASAPASTPSPTSTPSPAPKEKPTPSVPAKAHVSASTPAPPPVAAPAPDQTPAPPPRSASVAFNSKTLDPKQNARLKFDLSHFPPMLAFSVEMNGKLFFKGTAGKKSEFDGLYVPPGVHEFRVTVSSGSVQRTSNTVSADLVAKKRFTLKVELRPQANAATGALAPTTQVVATLKSDLFQF